MAVNNDPLPYASYEVQFNTSRLQTLLKNIDITIIELSMYQSFLHRMCYRNSITDIYLAEDLKKIVSHFGVHVSI